MKKSNKEVKAEVRLDVEGLLVYIAVLVGLAVVVLNFSEWLGVYSVVSCF